MSLESESLKMLSKKLFTEMFKGFTQILDSWNKFVQANLDELRSQGESRTSFLLRLTLSNPNISTIIVGTKDMNHLTENIKTALNGRLSSDVYKEANQRLKNLELNS